MVAIPALRAYSATAMNIPPSKTADVVSLNPGASPESQKLFLEHLKKINDVFYDQIRIADQKAAYIFTIMVAFMITSAEGRGAFRLERYLTGEPVSMVISGVLALAFTVTLCSAILVVLPRRLPTSTSLFWGAWDGHRKRFLDARERDDPGYLFEEYLGNVDNLAIIAASKYRFVGLAFRALLVGVIAYALLLFTQA